MLVAASARNTRSLLVSRYICFYRVKYRRSRARGWRGDPLYKRRNYRIRERRFEAKEGCAASGHVASRGCSKPLAGWQPSGREKKSFTIPRVEVYESRCRSTGGTAREGTRGEPWIAAAAAAGASECTEPSQKLNGEDLRKRDYVNLIAA